MGGKPLVQFSFLICFAAASALNCHVCEVANPYNGCIWGEDVCATGPNGTCETRLATFGPFYFLAWLGCASQSQSHNKSGLTDSFFGFTYNLTFCDSDNLCNKIPQLKHRWPWSGTNCQVLPNASGILIGALFHWMLLI